MVRLVSGKRVLQYAGAVWWDWVNECGNTKGESTHKLGSTWGMWELESVSWLPFS
jgi:hypothetical protein